MKNPYFTIIRKGRNFLDVGFPNAKIYFKKETESTMEDAHAITVSSKEEVSSGTVIITDYQKKGKGRLDGRRWCALPGKDLLFTIIVKCVDIPFASSLVPIYSAFVLCVTLSNQYGLSPLIKWPNDVILKGKKISGIRCELDARYIYIGIGVNCNGTFTKGVLSEKAISIRNVLSEEIDRYYLLESYLTNFKNNLTLEEWLESVNRLVYKQGQSVEVLIGHPDNKMYKNGLISHIGEQGELILKTDDCFYPVFSGEIVMGNW